MTKQDVIFSTICGLSVAWIAVDFLGKYGWVFFIILPILSVVGLYITEHIGNLSTSSGQKKFLFVHQVGKFSLAGAFADVVDIKVFQFLFLFIPTILLLKIFSFIIAAIVKYISDKYWAFEKHEKKDMHKEMAKFFMVAIVGMLINVASFYCLSKIETGLPIKMWLETSIILAAVIAAAWNFCGYKFLVFKK